MGIASIKRQPHLLGRLLLRLKVTVKYFVILLVIMLPPSGGGALAQEVIDVAIGPEFVAPFPAIPEFTGDFSWSGLSVRGYSYTDNSTKIIYSATYPLNQVNYDSSDPWGILRSHITGSTTTYIKPRTKLFESQYVGGSPAITFSVMYAHPQMPQITLEKHGIVILKEGKIFRWSVTGYVGFSTIDVSSVFSSLVSRVRFK